MLLVSQSDMLTTSLK